MSRFFLCLLIVICIVCHGNAQSQPKSKSFTASPAKTPQPPIEIAHDQHAKQLFANSQIRVYRIDLAAGAQTEINRHEHDFMVISLGNSQFELAGFGNAYPMTMADGEIQVLKGHWAHRVVNKSPAPLHIVEVEAQHDINPEKALCGLAAKSCISSRFAKSDEVNYVESLLFETPSVRLEKVEIEPGSGMPEHGHVNAHLMIALNDQQLTNIVVAGNTSEIVVHAGDPAWITGGIVHRLANKGSQPARFLTVECK